MTQPKLSINEEAFLANYFLLKSKTVGECGATVKSNAYGIGLARAVQTLDAHGCCNFFAANTAEGVCARQYTSGAIYILGGPASTAELSTYKAENLIPVLNSSTQLGMWEKQNQAFAIHIDTGMNRLGFDEQSLDQIDPFRYPTLELVMTHLACADQPEHPLNEQQLTRFEREIRPFMFADYVRTSIGNTAGVLLGRQFQGDITRPGIGLYGGNPFNNQPSPVQNVMRLEAPVVQIRSVPRGDSIGYGGTFSVTEPRRIAIVGIGYAHGLPRLLSGRGQVAFEGQTMPIVGRVTMDAIHIDCTLIPQLKEGHYVEVLGDTITVDKVAEQCNTIPYEIMTQVGNALAQDPDNLS